jgi:hydrogenase expression/formation protein HypD
VKHVDEYRDPARIERAAATLHASVTRPWVLMEVCGGQTHAFARWSLGELLPPGLELVHGPGCPVCVTPEGIVEVARRIALDDGAILATYGDMLRVPGTSGDLLSARALGADVRVVTSPLEALDLARRHPDREVVFFGVGFETTAPATATAVELADRLGLPRFSVLAAHVRVPPALEAILRSDDVRVQGFLAAGHVCTVEGTAAYEPIARAHRVPIVVTGFEPLDLLEGMQRAVAQLESGRHEVEVQYVRAVRPEGNPHAKRAVDDVFEVADVPWRGFGVLEQGGLVLRPRFERFDARVRFARRSLPVAAPNGCRAADVLRGVLRPDRCPEFGVRCTPDAPLGAPMVSTEGACAAYHRHRAHELVSRP